MAVSKWFDSNVYMANKLAQVKAGDPSGNWTMDKVVQVFAEAGFVGAEGAEAHFMQFGQFEDVAPNAYFNPMEYYRAKAAIINNKQDAPKTVTDAEAAFVKGAINSLGMGAWGHYKAFGSNEKVNPSNGFDTDAYMNAKMVALNAVDGGQKYELADVYAAFKASGISALEHFMLFGGAGAGEVKESYKGSIPDAFAVPEAKQVTPNGSSGTVFTLTASPSDVGVADVFNAPLFYNINSGTTQQTLNTGDKLTGTGTNATLNATMEDTTVAPTMTGVATLNLTANPNVGNSVGLNLVNATGVKHINSVGSLENLAVTNVNALVESVGMSNTLSNMTVTFADAALSGANDALTLKLNNVGSSAAQPTVTIQPTSATSGIETLNIVTSGAASRLDTLTGGNGTSLATINVAGDKALRIDTALDATVSTVDASGMTEGGSIRLELVTRAAGHKVTGSLGDDRVTIAGLNTKDVVDLGAGSGDMLIVKGAETSTTGETIVGLGTNITNVETLGIVAGAGGINTTTFDSTDIAGITGITLTSSDVSDAFTATINNGVLTSKDGNGVTLNTGATYGAIDITVKGVAATPNDHLTINIGSDKAANTTQLDAGAITADGIETLTIKVDDAASHTIASVSSSSLDTVNITGGVADTTTKITSAVNADIDAGDFLGNLDLTGAAAAGTISTQYVEMGSGNDLFTFSAGTPGTDVDPDNPVNIVTGGEGADTFKFAVASNTFSTAGFTSGNVKSAAQFDRIEDLDFGGESTNANTGNDLFQFNAGANAVARGKSQVVNGGQVIALSETAYATLHAALDAVVGGASVVKQGGGTATGVDNVGVAATNIVGLFSYKGDTFLVGEIGSASSATSANYVDSQNYIVSLTGVTGTLDAWDVEVV